MPTATITGKVEALVENTKYAVYNIENPRAFSRAIIKRSISVLYVFFEPRFEEAKILIEEISKTFRATDTLYYSPACAAILLVGCELKDAKIVTTRLQPTIDTLVKKLTPENIRYTLSHNTYTTRNDIPLNEFIEQVKDRLLGKTNIYLNPQN